MSILRSCFVSLCAAATLVAQADWPTPGNDDGGMKYSALKQINASNVTKLERAWTWDSGDKGGGFRGWEVTPIVIGGVMYFSTLGAKVVALDAATGKEIWKYDVRNVTKVGRTSQHGVSYWHGTAETGGPRIIVGTTDGFLIEIDAKTGQVAKNFNKDAIYDMKIGVTERFGGGYNIAAQPAIYKNLAILSASTGEQGRWGIGGDPRAVDLRTGEDVWTFHTVPRPGEPNFGTWGANGWQDRHGPGSWVPMTIDKDNGIVYISLGNPTDQNYGGSRPGTNLYSSSIIALDANTGKLKWYFQGAHHDIHDWDMNAPPTLITAKKDGKEIPALALSTKQGLLFVFNRLTGESLYGIEERPVPDTDAPGDKTWPTQPFPVKPEPLSRLSMTREEVSKISAETENACKALYDTAVQSGPMTPYLMVPSLVFPSSEGGGSWSGASFDPDLGYIVVNTRSLGTMGQLQPQLSSGVLPSYAKRKIPFDDPDGYPCSAPPWGELAAVNAATGDIVWRVPLGEYEELTQKGVATTGTPNAGGPMQTAGGLTFIGATADHMFHAFDSKTGKEVWKVKLENSAISTPITYLGKDGKQYVATVAGGGLDTFEHPQPPPGPNLIVAYKLAQ